MKAQEGAAVREPGAAEARFRLAAGITVHDKGGVLSVFVPETQRAFAMAGIAAEMLLDLFHLAGTGPLSAASYSRQLAGRYDEQRLAEAWNRAVAASLLLPEGAPHRAAPATTLEVGLVPVAASAETTATLARELADLGVTCATPESADDAYLPALLLGLDDVGDDRALVEFGRSLPVPGVPWLPVQVLHDTVLIGPVVYPGDSACFECAVTRRATALVPDQALAWSRRTVIRPDHVDRRAGVKLSSAVILQQVRAILREQPPGLLSRRLAFDAVSGEPHTSFVLEIPGCVTCRRTDGALR